MSGNGSASSCTPPPTHTHPSLATPARYSAAVAVTVRSSGKVVVAQLCLLVNPATHTYPVCFFFSLLVLVFCPVPGRILVRFFFLANHCLLLCRCIGNPIERRVSGGGEMGEKMIKRGGEGELFCVCVCFFCVFLCFSVFAGEGPYATLCPERMSPLFRRSNNDPLRYVISRNLSPKSWTQFRSDGVAL